VKFYIDRIQNGQYQKASAEIIELGRGVAERVVRTVTNYIIAH
jgi:hypothetical protein